MYFDCHVLLAMVCGDANGDIARHVKVTDHDGLSALDPLIDHCAFHGWLERRDGGKVQLTAQGKKIVHGWSGHHIGDRYPGV